MTSSIAPARRSRSNGSSPKGSLTQIIPPACTVLQGSWPLEACKLHFQARHSRAGRFFGAPSMSRNGYSGYIDDVAFLRLHDAARARYFIGRAVAAAGPSDLLVGDCR